MLKVYRSLLDTVFNGVFTYGMFTICLFHSITKLVWWAPGSTPGLVDFTSDNF